MEKSKMNARKIAIHSASSENNPESKIEREIIVVGGIAFYKSSGTSVSPTDEPISEEDKQRRDTWFPFFGLATSDTHFIKISELISNDRARPDPTDPYNFNEEALLCDDLLFNFVREKKLTVDLANRFRYVGIMLISAMIGGGFWNSDEGKSVVSELQDRFPDNKFSKIEIDVDDSVENKFAIILPNDKETLANFVYRFNANLEKNGATVEKYKSCLRPDMVCERAGEYLVSKLTAPENKEESPRPGFS